METAIRFILENIPLVGLILAFLLAFLRSSNTSYSESFTRYLLLLPVGLAGLWGFYYHAFHPQMAAEFIGWKDSPFQFEVAAANLGMGVAGVIGFWRGRDYALAVILMTSCFLWGAAYQHIEEIIQIQNYAPGNSGTILATDLLIPAALWIGYFTWRP